MKTIHSRLEYNIGMKELETNREALEAPKYNFNQTHESYHELLEANDEKEMSYLWFSHA